MSQASFQIKHSVSARYFSKCKVWDAAGRFSLNLFRRRKKHLLLCLKITSEIGIKKEKSNRKMTSAKVVINSASEVIEAFKLFDKNQDGHLTKDEITEFVLGLGGDISGPHFQELLADLETKGSITTVRFMKFWKTFKATETEDSLEDIKSIFQQYDLNGDGFITREELMEAISMMHVKDKEGELEKCLADIDVNGDGRVSYAEFLVKMKI